MPLRTLLILIALAIVFMTVKRLLAGRHVGGRTLKQSGSMVQCATCGMYVPEDEAIANSGRYYCSRKHLDEDGRHS